MHTFTQAAMPLKLFGAVLVLTLIAAVAVAVALTAGPTQAQNATNTYTDPKPCGPGAETAFQPEPHEIDEGHYALFDAYWETELADSEKEGNYLHTNLCPPLVTQTTEPDPNDPSGEAMITVTTLSESNIDIHEAIFHVKNTHQATAVDGAADDSNGAQISLDEYPSLRSFVDAGDPVWWLRLDDPDTEAVETSNLTLGFSTRHLDAQYWDATDGQPPLRYQLEVERYPGHLTGHPHFLAYRAPKENNGAQAFVWSSAEAGISEMQMEPGTQLEDLQWVFTEAGTYEIWVKLVAYVRHPDPAPADWTPISEQVTETSEVKRYVFQVGDRLDEVEPPQFGVRLSVPENSPVGTDVGDLIAVFSEADDLEYVLSGEGYENFVLSPATNPHTVQIEVAEHATLDYETEDTYNLTLEVTNNIDHESNFDPTIDDALTVEIALEDEGPYVRASVDNATPAANGTVHFTAEVGELPLGALPNYDWSRKIGDGVWESVYLHGERRSAHWSTSEPGGTSHIYRAVVTYSGEHIGRLVSQEIHVTWSNP